MFNKTLTQVMEKKGQTPYEIGNMVDINPKVIKKYMQGTVFPTGKTVRKLAEILGKEILNDYYVEYIIRLKKRKEYEMRGYDNDIAPECIGCVHADGRYCMLYYEPKRWILRCKYNVWQVPQKRN